MTETERRVGPTPERHNHGPIDPLAEVVTYDVNRRPERTLAPRAVDTLGRMLRRGSITVEMARAGTRFRNDFYRANLDRLKCSDVSRPYIGGKPICDGSFDIEARNNTSRALRAVGMVGESVLWHVVGLEETIKAWALEQGWNGRRVTEEAASGILISALGALVRHYDRGAR